ncbi:hybrid sensor histidine kinase/response regulator transcription factor [Flavobacterium sp. MAHUQ-51]|uniref:two-component regulator propeller domain-containing protein n=1 Tax=Flavobacterium sp. GCM10022190 TaxID=3252639 RepID=UPI003611A8CF
MLQKHFISSFYLLMTCLSGIAQPYSIKHLAIENGLSNNYVTDIAQDKQGCIWIATASGLNRFDGKNFVTYQKNNSQLGSNGLNALFYDKGDNKMWIGRKDGLSILDLSTYEYNNYTIKDNVKINNVVHISSSVNNGIWITNHSEGIVFYDKYRKQFQSYSEKNVKGLKGNNWCSFDDGKGHLYVGHAQNGLSIIDLKKKTARKFLNNPQNPKSLPGNSVYSICIDHLGNIWIGTNDGLALFNPRTNEFLSFKHEENNTNSLIADHIYSIKEMKDGTLWIASDIGGISILDLHNITFVNPKNIQFHNITVNNNNNGLSSGNIRSLLQDSFGNIWIGNYSTGLDFISYAQSSFHILPYYQSNNVLKNRPVWGICTDKEQQVWVGTETEIANFKDFKLKKTFNLAPSFARSYGQVFSIKSIKNGLLLGIYDDGLLKFNLHNNQIERIKLGSNYLDVITFFEDSDNTIWIGTEYGIYTYTNNVIHKEDKINNQLSDKSVYGIVKDKQGKLWIGTTGSGIFVFDKNEKLLLHLTEDNALKSNSINQLYSDSKGGVWATSRDGIAYFRDTEFPSKIKIYNEKQGLKDSYVRAIQEDRNGGIWISSNNSISYLDKTKKRFDNYDYRDGLPTGNFIEGSACSAKGYLYFGSLSGVCYFNPDDLITRNKVAPVKIIDCKRFKSHTEGKQDEDLILPKEGEISLAYNQNSFRISYSVTDFTQNQQVEYAYMMEGLDNNWYNTLQENYVTFRNIPHGNYIFKVKARLRNQNWDEAHIASISIYVSPPLWLTWYAKLFYAVIIFFVAYKLLRAYKHKLTLKNSLELERRNSINEQELNKERLRFYTNITHELRTPLTLILGPLEDLIHDKNLSSYHGRKINVIHSSALRLLNLINQILEFRTTETQNRKLTVCKDNIGNLVTEIGLRFKELNRNEEVTFHINIDTIETIIYFDSDIITSILKNLLSNAVKYTVEGEIYLILRSVKEQGNLYTEIEVKDTGYGINEKDLPRIFDRYFQVRGEHQASGTGIGLALVKSLSELHEGFLSVKSAIGEGTSFTFRILTQNTYPDALHKDVNNLPSENDLFVENNETEKDVVEKPIVLVIEDNTDIRDYITTSLENDYNVIVAENGKTGLEIAQNNIPNIIVSDIMMPIMDGIALCQSIKEDVRTSHIPVILLTAKDSIQDKEEGYEHGADSYITKPFSAKLLRIRIQNILESRKKLAEQIASQTSRSSSNLSENETKLSKLDENFLSKITTIVEENLESEKLNIAFMMEKMNMSHTAFYRKVKALTGMSANEFIRKIRLKNSLQLILSGSFNISEAAYKSGFNDLGYFRECFKEEYKISASEYMKQVQKMNKNN